jgi:RNA polymerase primary sigma factor
MSKQKAQTPALKTGAPRHKDLSKASPDTPRGAATPEGNGHASAAKTVAGVLSPERTAEIAEKIKELVRLAQEQGYLTYNDVNEALPDTMISGEELDEIYVKLRNLEVEIVDQAEVDRVKQPEPEEEEDKSRLDILDDPVRMYLKQMGQVPLLTREQEVEISKRIEDAENEVKNIIYSFGFAGKEHIALAEKLVSEPPRNDSTGSFSIRKLTAATRTCANSGV